MWASSALQCQYSYVSGNSSVVITNSIPYRALQQLGGTEAAFPNLGDSIRARQFIAVDTNGKLTEAARNHVTPAVEDYIEELIG